MVASMTAGADIITSNTNTPLPIQLEFDYEFDNAEIKDGLDRGKIMFTRRQNGILKIEQDINSLHTFTPLKNRE
ncbi:MAG: phage tail sheath protein, partial [Firmicutes bacterium]|nr:phage tail sheath protein [Bacillota bacterium]